jgi:hypothetical protein
VKKILAVLAIASIAVLAVPALASASSSCWYSVRGCVSVSGYYKPSTGTYVSPYYRNYPGYKAPSYKTPSYKMPSYKTPSYRTPSYSYASSYGAW